MFENLFTNRKRNTIPLSFVPEIFPSPCYSRLVASNLRFLKVFIQTAVLLLVVSFQPLSAQMDIDRQNNPQNPTLQNQNATNTTTTPVSYEEQIFSIKITLGDGRKASGKLRLAIPKELNLRHKVDGIAYQRKIRVTDIRLVEIQSWKPTLQRQNESGWIFEFAPMEITIFLSDGTNFTSEPFPFLKHIRLENEHGTVDFFSYWVDLQRKDGSWYTGLSGSSSEKRAVCLGEVVRKIEFMDSGRTTDDSEDSSTQDTLDKIKSDASTKRSMNQSANETEEAESAEGSKPSSIDAKNKKKVSVAKKKSRKKSKPKTTPKNTQPSSTKELPNE